MSLYLTAILPPAILAEEIDEIRREISEKYKVYAALKPPVHITLFRPLNHKESREDHLLSILKPISTRHRPFRQELLNFDSFNIQTLFLNAVKNPLLQNLQKDVAAAFTKNKIDPKEVRGSTRFHPHITVAYRDIPPEIFPVLWEEFKSRRFKRSFTVDHFSLLKHNGQKWCMLKEFPLQMPEILTLF